MGAPSPPPSSARPTLSRDAAIALAEQFVRDQGYTDAPPSPGAPALQRELTDVDEEETLALRRGQLVGRALGARDDGGGGWLVAFRQAKTSDPRAGRAVRLGAGAEPRMEHQSVFLDGFER